MKIAADAQERAKKIKLIIFDVDGTLTDGVISIGQDGELGKNFFARDGMGITLAHKAGMKTAIITGRQSPITAYRARELKISAIWQGVLDKRHAYEEAKAKFKVQDEEIAYVGDDLNDLPLLLAVGLACGVGDAVDEVKNSAHAVADYPGGRGAVRELMEFIIKAQGKWPEVIASFTSAAGAGKIVQ